MRHPFFVPIVLAATIAFAPVPALALKKVPYPAVKVDLPALYQGDEALEAMRKKLMDAIAKNNLAVLTGLVAPNFIWTAAGEPAEEFDKKRDAVHNFKVAFGFRAPGKNTDGPTEIGPQWELLALFAGDNSLTQEPGSPLVCGPAAAKLSDPKAFEQAVEKVEGEDEPAEWAYVNEEIALTASPTGDGTVEKVSRLALPLVSVHPDPLAAKPLTQPQPPTHIELLLPSGKTGWAPIDAMRPLFTDRLCYAKTPAGDWKIAAFDQAE